jgi:uncharacterized protein YlxW (UPF0749 family)
MDILQILKTIQEDWLILLFFFGLGGAWIQGKMWFNRVNYGLSKANDQHSEQNRILTSVQHDLINLKDKVNDIEYTVKSIHEEVHDQEIKLAVLESKKNR